MTRSDLDPNKDAYDESLWIRLDYALRNTCEKALKVEPENPLLLLGMARLELFWGLNPEAAVPLLEKALVTTNNITVQALVDQQLIKAYAILNNAEKYVQHLDKLKLDRHPDDFYYLAVYSDYSATPQRFKHKTKLEYLKHAYEKNSYRAALELANHYLFATSKPEPLKARNYLTKYGHTDHPSFNFFLGYSYARFGRTREDYQKAHEYFDSVEQHSELSYWQNESAWKNRFWLDFDLVKTDRWHESIRNDRSIQDKAIARLEKFVRDGGIFSANKLLETIVENQFSSSDDGVKLAKVVRLAEQILVQANEEYSTETDRENFALNQAHEGFWQLALLYDYSTNQNIVSQDSEKSRKYMRIAADLGHQKASIAIGWRLLKASNPNFEEAEKYLKQGSEGKDADSNVAALNNLGVLYFFRNSEGDDERRLKSYETAIELIKEKNLQGGSTAYPFSNLARLYFFGNVVSPDYDKALELAREAKRRDSRTTFYDLIVAKKLANPKSEDELVSWANNLSERGHYHANREIAWQVMHTNPELAMKLFKVCSFVCSSQKARQEAQKEFEQLSMEFSGKRIASIQDDAYKASQDLLKAALAFSSKVDSTPQDPKSIDSRNRQYGNYYALFIGNNDYQFLPKLASPVNDVQELGQLLESSFGFTVETLIDASRKDTIRALNKLRDVLEPSDNLVIYYAGHGIEESSEGFWLPVDAEENDDYGWISNSYISRKLREIKANNILVIADSCFSGTITRDANQLGSQKKNYSIDEYDFFYRTKTRMALTAGGREPVLDSGIDGHSVFAGALISSLKNKKGPISATEIFQSLRSKVIANSLKMGSPQTPILQSIPLSGHDDPDFVFLAR